MSDTHKKLQYGNNYNHWKILDLVLDIFFLTLSQTVTRRTYPNTKP